MRFIRTELSPANKKQYAMAMGKKDIELLHEIALMAHRYTPNTKELHDAKRRLASIAKAFAAAMAEAHDDSDEGEKLPLEKRQAYKDKLEANPMMEITRLEIIDHRPCNGCHGTGYVMNNKDNGRGLICGKCQGVGSRGREVVFWDDKAEVKSSVQDMGRTMKLFIEERKR